MKFATSACAELTYVAKLTTLDKPLFWIVGNT